MKTMNFSAGYIFEGVAGNQFVFTKFLENSDPEVVELSRARYVRQDGSVLYCDPIRMSDAELAQYQRVMEYRKAFLRDGEPTLVPVPVCKEYVR